MVECYRSIPIDEVCFGDAGQLVELADFRFGIESYDKRDFVFTQELDDIALFLVDRDRADMEIGSLEDGAQALDRRHFFDTWFTPGRPEVEEQEFSFVIGEGELLVTRGGEIELRRGSTLHVRGALLLDLCRGRLDRLGLFDSLVKTGHGDRRDEEESERDPAAGRGLRAWVGVA